jgi:ATP-dependent Lon protease
VTTNRTLELPILPIRNIVLFPYVLMPLSVSRPASMAAVNAAATSEDKQIAVFAQRDAQVDEPGPGDIYTVGTKAVIKRLVRSEEALELVLLGVERLELVELGQSPPLTKGRFRPLALPASDGDRAEAMQREVLELAGNFLTLAQPKLEIDLEALLAQEQEPMQLVYMLATMAGLDVPKAQAVLEAHTRLEALGLLHGHLQHEYQILKLRKEIAGKAESEMGREQREYWLRQQMRAIQEQLGEKNPQEEAVQALRKRFEEADLPEYVRTEVERELGRLEGMTPASPEYQVTRSYLELVLELPWKARTEDKLDLARARQVLDEDHFGLQEIKERILEYLAVMKLNPEAQAPILCFVGAPGVGKTSLGQSIARAIGRKFERFSLGGLHDESELRGHRRTYVGAMPGRIVQALRRAKVRNPLLMLDEVDKLGRDFRGDPASALLEILDPAQNREFRDNYLDLPFDLSKVFFITTANSLDPIPRPLLDRMEILHLSGYSDEEKLEIASRYLLRRQRTQAGLAEEQLVVPEPTMRAIIRRYTREAGVRELERMLGRLARKVALRLTEGRGGTGTISVEQLSELLGPERFFPEQARRELPPGVATGLAWTEAGGEVLYVEAILIPEGDRLTLTGQLGQVMQESARAAQSYVVSHGDALSVTLPKAGVHIHVPAGAIPKDGPSAGVTMATALASLYTNQAVRSDTAMTGEITLTGLVLPVGGIKEKVLAARRAGIRRVILPAVNVKDLRELPEPVRQELEIVGVERIEEVLAAAIPGLAERLAVTRASRTS